SSFKIQRMPSCSSFS
ncbi:hypothetical protein D030_1310, partial [Vibrio parahaemolyticus AQ3810]